MRRARFEDSTELAEICTEVFFGSHSFTDGPVIYLQRAQIKAKVLAQLQRRLFEDDGRECQLLVAEDRLSRRICGCVDLAIHLYDELDQRLELTLDQMPLTGVYSWQVRLAAA